MQRVDRVAAIKRVWGRRDFMVSDEFVEVPLDSRGGDLEELQEKLMNIGTISTK